MEVKSLAAGVVVLAALAIRADIVTNAETLVISSPTTFLAVTNIYTHTTFPAQIDADLTLDNRSYLRFMGANTTGTSGNPTDTQPVIKIGTTPRDVTLTVKGNSMFAATYRNSKSSTAWVNTKIDPPDNGNAAPSRIRVHLGTPEGTPGSTGEVKIDLRTNPSFGGNAFSGFWAEWLYVNSSVKPSASGYIDFLDVASGVTADISFIDNLSDTPARILFSGGLLLRNNALPHDAPLAVSAGHELILEGKIGSYSEYVKQYAACNLTARRGGIVRFRGNEVRLRSRGNCVRSNNFNFVRWFLSAADNIVWEQTGQLYLMENCFLGLQSDDVLPHAAVNGHIRFNCNTSNQNNPEFRNHCVIDIDSTTQHVNGLVSDNQTMPMIGVVSNNAYSTGASLDRGTLIFGEHNFSTVFNARCTPGVDVRKIGAGRLTVRNASGENLVVESGSASFTDGSAFDTLAVSNGVSLVGTVGVGALALFEPTVNATALALELAAGAKIKAANALVVESLRVDGTEVAAGVYSTAGWMAEGSAAVTVLRDLSQTASTVIWTGVGTDTSVSTAENWDDASKAVFTAPVTHAQFATAGSAAVFPSGMSYLNALTFNAAGAFTLSGSDANSALTLYEALTLGGSGTRTYTVNMPLSLRGTAKTITVPASDVTLQLRDLSGACAIEIEGEKLSDLAYDYATNGVVVLENPRTDGDISHTKGGGTVILRGEVGVIGDSGTYTLDYGRYRNGKDQTGGWCEAGITRMENVLFRKKLQINGAGQVTGSTGTSRFLTFCGVTNVFKEQVTETPSSTVRGERGTVTIFEKGYANTSGTREFCGQTSGSRTTTSSEPAVFIFDGPLTTASTARPLIFSDSYVKAIFRSTGNQAKMYMALYANAQVEIRLDDAFIDTDLYFLRNATVDLCGTHQKLRNLMSNGTSDAASNYGTFTTVKPATLEVTAGAPNRACCNWVTTGDWLHLGVSTNSTQQFLGPVSLVKSGAGYLLMNRNGAIASTGNVTVKGGTLEFTARASWPAAGTVTASDVGALVLGSADTFGKDVSLHLADSGTLVLPAGEMMRVGELWLDGASQPARSGVYGAVGDAGATYTTTHILSGRVRVTNRGTRLFLK